MVCIAFTNYDYAHMPPSKFFSWVGWDNFATIFSGSSSSNYFGYAFLQIFWWTLVWALFATITCYFGGLILALLINSKKTVEPKVWRTIFVITIAVPQFVSLMGVFYWEPAWLPVKGSSWASAAGQKYADTGTDMGKSGTAYSDGLVTWANQSWFSSSGKATVSAASYKHIKAKDLAGTEMVKSLVKDTLDLSINLAIATEGLPSTVQAVTNTDAYRDVLVTWDAAEVAAMKAGGAGTYTIHGRLLLSEVDPQSQSDH